MIDTQAAATPPHPTFSPHGGEKEQRLGSFVHPWLNRAGGATGTGGSSHGHAYGIGVVIVLALLYGYRRVA